MQDPLKSYCQANRLIQEQMATDNITMDEDGRVWINYRRAREKELIDGSYGTEGGIKLVPSFSVNVDLIGPDSITVNTGETFVDTGAIATLTENLSSVTLDSSMIVSNSTVDIDTAGTYEVNYTIGVKDEETGIFMFNEVNREVHVVDQTDFGLEVLGNPWSGYSVLLRWTLGPSLSSVSVVPELNGVAGAASLTNASGVGQQFISVPTGAVGTPLVFKATATTTTGTLISIKRAAITSPVLDELLLSVDETTLNTGYELHSAALAQDVTDNASLYRRDIGINLMTSTTKWMAVGHNTASSRGDMKYLITRKDGTSFEPGYVTGPGDTWRFLDPQNQTILHFKNVGTPVVGSSEDDVWIQDFVHSFNNGDDATANTFNSDTNTNFAAYQRYALVARDWYDNNSSPPYIQEFEPTPQAERIFGEINNTYDTCEIFEKFGNMNERSVRWSGMAAMYSDVDSVFTLAFYQHNNHDLFAPVDFNVNLFPEECLKLSNMSIHESVNGESLLINPVLFDSFDLPTGVRIRNITSTQQTITTSAGTLSTPVLIVVMEDSGGTSHQLHIPLVPAGLTYPVTDCIWAEYEGSTVRTPENTSVFGDREYYSSYKIYQIIHTLRFYAPRSSALNKTNQGYVGTI